jgi:hypothetical protein
VSVSSRRVPPGGAARGSRWRRTGWPRGRSVAPPQCPEAAGRDAAMELPGARPRRRSDHVLPVAGVTRRRGEVPLRDGAARRYGHPHLARGRRPRPGTRLARGAPRHPGARRGSDPYGLAQLVGPEQDSHPSAGIVLAERLREHYAPLWQANIATDVVHPESDLSGYRLVVVPNLYLVSDAAISNLHDYVRSGGHLLMSFSPGSPTSATGSAPAAIQPRSLACPACISASSGRWATALKSPRSSAVTGRSSRPRSGPTRSSQPGPRCWPVM